ncbi:hypothetical protein RI367_004856 [Sorochytrium milnesiophthora]
MTTFILPVACWSHHAPDATITHLTPTASGTHIVACMANGLSWVLRLGRDSTTGAMVIRPKVLLVGHQQAVRTATVATQDVDVGAAGEEEVIVTASESGDLIMWNVMDGQCVQMNARVLDGVPLSVQTAPSASHLFVAGCSNYIQILDSRTMEIVRTSPDMGNWIVSLAAIPAGQKNLFLSFRKPDPSAPPTDLQTIADDPNRIRLFTLNQTSVISEWAFHTASLAFSAEPVHSVDLLQMDGGMMHFSASYLSLKLCKSDSLIGMAIGRRSVKLFRIEPVALAMTSQLDGPPLGGSWAGGEFINAQTIILWTQFGIGHVYSLQAGKLRLLTTYSHERQEHMSAVSCFIPWGSSPAFIVTRSNAGRSEIIVFDVAAQHLSEQQEAPILPSQDLWFKDLWPLSAESLPDKTTYAFCDGDLVVRSNDNGELSLDRLQTVFTGREVEPTTHAKLHHGRVNALLTSDSGRHIISGGADCVVRVSSLPDLIPLAAFTQHPTPIVALIHAPPDAGPLMMSCVLAISADHSMSIISIDKLSTLYYFSGHAHPIVEVVWRTQEDYLLIACADETVYVWQLKLGQLDRTVYGALARDILDSSGDCRVRVSRMVDLNGMSFKSALSCFPVAYELGAASSPPLHIFMTNVKRAILSPQAPAPATPAIVTPSAPTTPVSALQSLFAPLPQPDTNGDGTAHPEESTLLERALLSALLTFDIDADVDNLAEHQLGLMKHLSNVTIGLRGVAGNLSVLAPSDGKGREQDAAHMLTVYLTRLPQVIGSAFCYPSLAFLARYWQDSSPEIQHAARRLFIEALNQMPNDKKVEIVLYWSRHLPSVAPGKEGLTKTMARATIILGVLGSEYAESLPQKCAHPAVFSYTTKYMLTSVVTIRVAKDVALSLTVLLNEEGSQKANYRLAACELLGKGFKTWEPYINGSAVVRSLISYTMQNTASQFVVMAKQALYHISTSNVALLVQTVTFDLVHSRGLAEKSGLMKLVSGVMQKNPLLLYSFIPRIAEATVKVLDPSMPGTRESIIQPTTALLYELVKRYPFVAFHGGTQRLAIGTLEGSTILYDLKTATRWQVLEGHTGAVSAVCFSGDGKHMASYSTNEGNVRFWQPSTGFFGALASTISGASGSGANLKSHRTVKITKGKAPSPRSEGSLAIPPMTAPVSHPATPSPQQVAHGPALPPEIFGVKLEYMADGKSVTLTLPDETFTIPA